MRFDPEKFLNADNEFAAIPPGVYITKLDKWEIKAPRSFDPNKEGNQCCLQSVMHFKIDEPTSAYNKKKIFLVHRLEFTQDEPNYGWFQQDVDRLGFELNEFAQEHERLMPEAIGSRVKIKIEQATDENNEPIYTRAGKLITNVRMDEILELTHKSQATSQVPQSQQPQPAQATNTQEESMRAKEPELRYPGLAAGDQYVYDGVAITINMVSPDKKTAMAKTQDGKDVFIKDTNDLDTLGGQSEPTEEVEDITSMELETPKEFTKGEPVKGMYGAEEIVGKVHAIGDNGIIKIVRDGKAYPCKKESVTRV